MIFKKLYFNPLIIFILFLFQFQVFGQNGNPYITNFQPDEFIDNQNWAINQDNDNVMLFANRKGILTFDSEEWSIVKTPDIPYSIAKEQQNGQIFVGCNENFGYIVKNDTGKYIYYSLSENFNQLGEITNIEITKEHLFFYGSNSITRVTINDLNDQKQWIGDPSRPFIGIVKYHDRMFINIEGIGLHEIVEDSILAITGKPLFANTEILFSIPFDDKKVLLGTDDDQLFLFDGNEIIEYSVKDQEYLSESVLLGGIELSKDEIVLATLLGGAW